MHHPSHPIMAVVTTTGTTARRAAYLLAVIAAGGLAVGCSTDKLLTVDNPSIAQPNTLNGTAGLAAYYGAALGDFAVGYAGDGGGNSTGSVGSYEGLINFGGLLSDEIGSVDTFPTRNEVDQRSTQFNNASNADIFRAIQRSHSTAELAAAQFAQYGATDARRSEVLSLAGFSYILIAESYCSGVPFSQTAPDGITVTYGQPLTTDQIFQLAVAKFDTALSVAASVPKSDANFASGPDLTNLARVGRARALVGLNRLTDAAAQAAPVPASFVYSLYTSANTSRQNNGVYYYDNINQRFSAIDREGGNGLPFLSDSDPRVKYHDTKKPGFDGARDLVNQLKYPTRTSPIPLATGAEALYIQAEAALAPGGSGSFIDFINQARATDGLTTTVADPGTATGRVDLLFKERAYSLWLTAHRLGDMRRLVRVYKRPASTVYPVGQYSGGGTYGTDVNLPIPVQEQNNPNYTGSCNKAAP